MCAFVCKREMSIFELSFGSVFFSPKAVEADTHEKSMDFNREEIPSLADEPSMKSQRKYEAALPRPELHTPQCNKTIFRENLKLKCVFILMLKHFLDPVLMC